MGHRARAPGLRRARFGPTPKQTADDVHAHRRSARIGSGPSVWRALPDSEQTFAGSHRSAHPRRDPHLQTCHEYSISVLSTLLDLAYPHYYDYPIATMRSIGTRARCAMSSGTRTSNWLCSSASRSLGSVIIFMYWQLA